MEKLKNIAILKEIGLTTSEAKTYMTLLEVGSTTTGPLMSKAKISSSKVYGILARLQEKGLVSFILKNNVKHYQAASPKALENYMQEKEEELQKQKDKIKELLPLFSRPQKEKKEDAQVYLGWKGLISAFTDFLEETEERGEYIGFAQTEGEEKSKEVKQFFSKYQKKREEKKLEIRLLAPERQRRIFTANPYKKAKRFTVKYVNSSPPSMVIAKNRILLSTFEEQPIAIIISSQALAKAYRNYFERLWKEAKE